jgi:hypothetical protein
VWQSTNDEQHAALINLYFEQAGLFDARSFHDISPNPGRSDPLFMVMAKRSI